MEVGGAYAHRFYDLLNFLELRTLVITDIDSVAPNASTKRVAVPVAQGTFTSNPCIKAWFAPDVSPAQLVAQTAAAQISAVRPLSTQFLEDTGGPPATGRAPCRAKE